MRQLVPRFVDCGLGIGDFHLAFDSYWLMHQTVVEFGQVSSFRRCGPYVFVGFSAAPALFADVHGSKCPVHLNIGIKSGFPEHTVLLKLRRSP